MFSLPLIFLILVVSLIVRIISTHSEKQFSKVNSFLHLETTEMLKVIGVTVTEADIDVILTEMRFFLISNHFKQCFVQLVSIT